MTCAASRAGTLKCSTWNKLDYMSFWLTVGLTWMPFMIVMVFAFVSNLCYTFFLKSFICATATSRRKPVKAWGKPDPINGSLIDLPSYALRVSLKSISVQCWSLQRLTVVKLCHDWIMDDSRPQRDTVRQCAWLAGSWWCMHWVTGFTEASEITMSNGFGERLNGDRCTNSTARQGLRWHTQMLDDYDVTLNCWIWKSLVKCTGSTED